MDRLIDAIEATQNPSVVGLDPTEALVPPQVVAGLADEVRDSVEDPAEAPALQLASAFYEFNRTIIDAVAGIVPAVKPQIAMYEALGPAGVDVYTMTCDYAASRGLYVLADAKRGDIGSTAAAYAHMLTGVDGFDPWKVDAVTVNPYLGTDGITPFVDAAKESDKDLFVLVHLRTVGAVVGATHPEEGKALRKRMPHTFFLVPGYGAQGGTAADVRGMFDADGSGAIVNSSRGIIGAWKKDGRYSPSMSADDALALVDETARAAAIRMRDDLRAVL